MWSLGRSTLFSRPRPAFVSLRTLNSISLGHVSPCLCLDDDEFLPWLRRKSGVEISSSLKIGRSEYGRSLFASKFIEEGECILKIPYSSLTPDKVFPEFKSLLGDDVSSKGKLALALLAEEKLGWASEWAPYVACLPRPGELHSMIFWDKLELEPVRPSSILHETTHLQDSINKDFSALMLALKGFPKIVGSLEFEKFKHAYAVVGSRAWDGTKQGLSLIPFADFLNHDGCSESVLLGDDDKEYSEVIADRNYCPGEEVLISYGKFSNATLLLDFGFTLPCNPYDQVHIWMNVPKHDPLFGMKLELLHRHRTPTTSQVDFLEGTRSVFTIKEVRSERGRGFPLPLRAFARVLTVTTPQELARMSAEAVKGDGRLARFPLENTNKEIEAHRLLLAEITPLIEERFSSISLLESESSSINCGQLKHRRKLARDLLNGELRVLRSAASWLTRYCATLSAGFQS